MNGWEWRQSSTIGVPLLDADTWNHHIFHAYDGNDHAACAPGVGLVASTEPVNEGSELHETCMEIVRTTPADPPIRRSRSRDDG